jgi:hypothetical protein
MSGMEEQLARDETVTHVASVATFFVSRIGIKMKYSLTLV